MAWKAYFISPIDFGWELLPTIEDAAASIARNEANNLVVNLVDGDSKIPQLFADFELARKLAHDAGWDGDYRTGHEPRVFWIPVEGKFVYGFAWKQDNNGDTLVASPQPLAWLDRLSLT